MGSSETYFLIVKKTLEKKIGEFNKYVSGLSNNDLNSSFIQHAKEIIGSAISRIDDAEAVHARFLKEGHYQDCLLYLERLNNQMESFKIFQVYANIDVNIDVYVYVYVHVGTIYIFNLIYLTIYLQ